MESPSTDSYAYYQEDGQSSYFITDDGRRYSVAFEEQPFVDRDEFPYAAQTYEVFLTLEKAPPSYTKDPRMGATVTAIIHHFIEQDPIRLVFFTCDTVDGRHLARYKRFNEWYSLNNNGFYLKLEDSVSYPAIHKLFLVTLMMRNDYPYSGDMLASFARLNARLRSQK